MLKEQQAQDLAKRRSVKKVHITENATGFSFVKLFGKYLDSGVQEIIIVEPYLGRPFQMYNLLMFIELSVANCSQLKVIKVETKPGEDPKEQASALSQIREDLASRNIKLLSELNPAAHDRSI